VAKHLTNDSIVTGLTPTTVLSSNSLGHVVHTHVPLTPSSITWYQQKLHKRCTSQYPWPLSISCCLAQGYRNKDQHHPMGPCGSRRTLHFFTNYYNAEINAIAEDILGTRSFSTLGVRLSCDDVLYKFTLTLHQTWLHATSSWIGSYDKRTLFSLSSMNCLAAADALSACLCAASQSAWAWARLEIRVTRRRTTLYHTRTNHMLLTRLPRKWHKSILQVFVALGH